MANKTEGSIEEIDIKKESFGEVHDVEVNPAAAALAAATEAVKPRMFSPGMVRLWMILGIGYLISTMNGFDSSLMGSINAMVSQKSRAETLLTVGLQTTYQSTFGLSGAGSSTGMM